MNPVAYPHCRHCAWNNPHHTPDGHTTPCSSGCVNQQPVADQPLSAGDDG